MIDPDRVQVVVGSREEAVAAMQRLANRGWQVFAQNHPLAAQAGFYCVKNTLEDDGTTTRHAHSIMWNLYEHELAPIEIDCENDLTLTDFVLGHFRHDTFGFFQYPNRDVGFLCYCQGHNGRSTVLRIPDELDMNENSLDFIWQYQQEL
jgi:hypothetical protein